MILAIRLSLPYAIGVVLIAAPLLTISLVLSTSRPRIVSTMFLVGWATGIITAAGIIVAFVDVSAPRGLPPATLAVIRIVLGVTLGILAIRSWRKRADASEGPPKWISNLANWSTSRAFVVGFSLSSINPKNLAPVAAGAAAILGASQTPLEQAVAIVAFAAVASLGIATPVILRAIGGRVDNALDGATEWMTKHAEMLSIVVLAILAVVLTSTGIVDL